MRTRHRERPWGLVVDAWVVVLAAVLALPLVIHPGHGLAHDLMFTPRQPLTPDALGLGSSLPRAVPVDAVVALLCRVVDGAVVYRVAVLGVLLLAGWGAHRLMGERSLPARWCVATFAVWNPFVVERLGLGQWSFLASYAAAWWLVPAVVRYRSADPGTGDGRDLAAVVGWTALASLTPTGGLIACLLVGWPRGAHPDRRWGWSTGAAVLLQLPWLLPSLLTTASALTSPDSVAAFSARSERPGGAFASLLGLGGIWSRDVVPASRGGVLGFATTGLVLLVLAAGVRRLPWGSRALVPLGALGLLLAVASSTPSGDDVVSLLVGEVPGAGLLRDAQKWLLPFVLLVGACLGVVVDGLTGWVGRRAPELTGVLGIAAVLGPVVLLLDAPSVTWRVLQPVTYPADFHRVAAAVEAGAGDLVTLPWQSYRRFAWGTDVTAADPATRLFDVPVVVDDRLVVGGRRLEGEDRRAASLTPVVTAGSLSAPRLREGGVRWVLVYVGQPSAARVGVTELDRVYVGRNLALYRVPGEVVVADRAPTWKVVLVSAVNVLALLAAVTAGAAAVLQQRRRPAHRSGGVADRHPDPDSSASLRST